MHLLLDADAALNRHGRRGQRQAFKQIQQALQPLLALLLVLAVAQGRHVLPLAGACKQGMGGSGTGGMCLLAEAVSGV